MSVGARMAERAGLRSYKAAVPWAVMLGLFAVTAIYIVVAVPGSDVPTTGQPPVVVPHSDGLSDRHAGYQLEPITLPAVRGDAVPLAFRILGPTGAPAADGYAQVQTMPLHLYVVRDDLSTYQHLHPRLMGDTWNATVRVADGGVYRVFAEFTPAELATAAHPIVLGTWFIITGDTAQMPLPMPTASVTIGGFTVSRVDGATPLTPGAPTALGFQVLDDGGAPVASLEPYLGAFAHVSAFDVLTQALTHLHPVPTADVGPPLDATLTFHTAFAHRGLQRLFLQFQVAGTIHVAAFTVLVS